MQVSIYPARQLHNTPGVQQLLHTQSNAVLGTYTVYGLPMSCRTMVHDSANRKSPTRAQKQSAKLVADPCTPAYIRGGQSGVVSTPAAHAARVGPTSTSTTSCLVLPTLKALSLS